MKRKKETAPAAGPSSNKNKKVKPSLKVNKVRRVFTRGKPVASSSSSSTASASAPADDGDRTQVVDQPIPRKTRPTTTARQALKKLSKKVTTAGKAKPLSPPGLLDRGELVQERKVYRALKLLHIDFRQNKAQYSASAGTTTRRNTSLVSTPDTTDDSTVKDGAGSHGEHSTATQDSAGSSLSAQRAVTSTRSVLTQTPLSSRSATRVDTTATPKTTPNTVTPTPNITTSTTPKTTPHTTNRLKKSLSRAKASDEVSKPSIQDSTAMPGPRTVAKASPRTTATAASDASRTGSSTLAGDVSSSFLVPKASKRFSTSIYSSRGKPEGSGADDHQPAGRKDQAKEASPVRKDSAAKKDPAKKAVKKDSAKEARKGDPATREDSVLGANETRGRDRASAFRRGTGVTGRVATGRGAVSNRGFPTGSFRGRGFNAARGRGFALVTKGSKFDALGRRKKKRLFSRRPKVNRKTDEPTLDEEAEMSQGDQDDDDGDDATSPRVEEPPAKRGRFRKEPAQQEDAEVDPNQEEAASEMDTSQAEAVLAKDKSLSQKGKEDSLARGRVIGPRTSTSRAGVRDRCIVGQVRSGASSRSSSPGSVESRSSRRSGARAGAVLPRSSSLDNLLVKTTPKTTRTRAGLSRGAGDKAEDASLSDQTAVSEAGAEREEKTEKRSSKTRSEGGRDLSSERATEGRASSRTSKPDTAAEGDTSTLVTTASTKHTTTPLSTSTKGTKCEAGPSTSTPGSAKRKLSPSSSSSVSDKKRRLLTRLVDSSTHLMPDILPTYRLSRASALADSSPAASRESSPGSVYGPASSQAVGKGAGTTPGSVHSTAKRKKTADSIDTDTMKKDSAAGSNSQGAEDVTLCDVDSSSKVTGGSSDLPVTHAPAESMQSLASSVNTQHKAVRRRGRPRKHGNAALNNSAQQATSQSRSSQDSRESSLSSPDGAKRPRGRPKGSTNKKFRFHRLKHHSEAAQRNLIAYKIALQSPFRPVAPVVKLPVAPVVKRGRGRPRKVSDPAPAPSVSSFDTDTPAGKPASVTTASSVKKGKKQITDISHTSPPKSLTKKSVQARKDRDRVAVEAGESKDTGEANTLSAGVSEGDGSHPSGQHAAASSDATQQHASAGVSASNSDVKTTSRAEAAGSTSTARAVGRKGGRSVSRLQAQANPLGTLVRMRRESRRQLKHKSQWTSPRSPQHRQYQAAVHSSVRVKRQLPAHSGLDAASSSTPAATSHTSQGHQQEEGTVSQHRQAGPDRVDSSVNTGPCAGADSQMDTSDVEASQAHVQDDPGMNSQAAPDLASGDTAKEADAAQGQGEVTSSSSPCVASGQTPEAVLSTQPAAGRDSSELQCQDQPETDSGEHSQAQTNHTSPDQEPAQAPTPCEPSKDQSNGDSAAQAPGTPSESDSGESDGRKTAAHPAELCAAEEQDETAVSEQSPKQPEHKQPEHVDGQDATKDLEAESVSKEEEESTTTCVPEAEESEKTETSKQEGAGGRAEPCPEGDVSMEEESQSQIGTPAEPSSGVIETKVTGEQSSGEVLSHATQDAIPKPQTSENAGSQNNDTQSSMADSSVDDPSNSCAEREAVSGGLSAGSEAEPEPCKTHTATAQICADTSMDTEPLDQACSTAAAVVPASNTDTLTQEVSGQEDLPAPGQSAADDGLPQGEEDTVTKAQASAEGDSKLSGDAHSPLCADGDSKPASSSTDLKEEVPPSHESQSAKAKPSESGGQSQAMDSECDGQSQAMEIVDGECVGQLEFVQQADSGCVGRLDLVTGPQGDCFGQLQLVKKSDSDSAAVDTAGVSSPGSKPQDDSVSVTDIPASSYSSSDSMKSDCTTDIPVSSLSNKPESENLSHIPVSDSKPESEIIPDIPASSQSCSDSTKSESDQHPAPDMTESDSQCVSDVAVPSDCAQQPEKEDVADITKSENEQTSDVEMLSQTTSSSSSSSKNTNTEKQDPETVKSDLPEKQESESVKPTTTEKQDSDTTTSDDGVKPVLTETPDLESTAAKTEACEESLKPVAAAEKQEPESAVDKEARQQLIEQEPESAVDKEARQQLMEQEPESAVDKEARQQLMEQEEQKMTIAKRKHCAISRELKRLQTDEGAQRIMSWHEKKKLQSLGKLLRSKIKDDSDKDQKPGPGPDHSRDRDVMRVRRPKSTTTLSSSTATSSTKLHNVDSHRSSSKLNSHDSSITRKLYSINTLSDTKLVIKTGTATRAVSEEKQRTDSSRPAHHLQPRPRSMDREGGWGRASGEGVSNAGAGESISGLSSRGSSEGRDKRRKFQRGVLSLSSSVDSEDGAPPNITEMSPYKDSSTRLERGRSEELSPPPLIRPEDLFTEEYYKSMSGKTVGSNLDPRPTMAELTAHTATTGHTNTDAAQGMEASGFSDLTEGRASAGRKRGRGKRKHQKMGPASKTGRAPNIRPGPASSKLGRRTSLPKHDDPSFVRNMPSLPQEPRTFALRPKMTRSPIEIIAMRQKLEEEAYELEEATREARKLKRRQAQYDKLSMDSDPSAHSAEGAACKPCSVVLVDFVKELHLNSIDTCSDQYISDVSYDSLEEDVDDDYDDDDYQEEIYDDYECLDESGQLMSGARSMQGEAEEGEDAGRAGKTPPKTRTSPGGDVSKSPPDLDTLRGKGFMGNFVDFIQNQNRMLPARRSPSFPSRSKTPLVLSGEGVSVCAVNAARASDSVVIASPLTTMSGSSSSLAVVSVPSHLHSTVTSAQVQSVAQRTVCDEEENKTVSSSPSRTDITTAKDKAPFSSPTPTQLHHTHSVVKSVEKMGSQGGKLKVFPARRESEGSSSSSSERGGVGGTYTRYLCSKCEFSATNKGTMESHIYRHIPGVTFTCGYCRSEFTGLISALTHVKNSHSSKEPQVWISKDINEATLYTEETVQSPPRALTPSGGVGECVGDGGEKTAASQERPPGVGHSGSGSEGGGGGGFSSSPLASQRRFACTHCGYCTGVVEDAHQHARDLHWVHSLYTCALCDKALGCSHREVVDHCAATHPDRPQSFKKLPDFYDQDLLRMNAGDRAKIAEDRGNIFDRMSNLFPSLGPGGEILDDGQLSPQARYLRARDYLYIREGWSKKTSAEADSTTIEDIEVPFEDSPEVDSSSDLHTGEAVLGSSIEDSAATSGHISHTAASQDRVAVLALGLPPSGSLGASGDVSGQLSASPSLTASTDGSHPGQSSSLLSAPPLDFSSGHASVGAPGGHKDTSGTSDDTSSAQVDRSTGKSGVENSVPAASSSSAHPPGSGKSEVSGAISESSAEKEEGTDAAALALHGQQPISTNVGGGGDDDDDDDDDDGAENDILVIDLGEDVMMEDEEESHCSSPREETTQPSVPLEEQGPCPSAPQPQTTPRNAKDAEEEDTMGIKILSVVSLRDKDNSSSTSPGRTEHDSATTSFTSTPPSSKKRKSSGKSPNSPGKSLHSPGKGSQLFSSPSAGKSPQAKEGRSPGKARKKHGSGSGSGSGSLGGVDADAMALRNERMVCTYKCHSCSIHSPALSAIVEHLKLRHSDVPLFSCPYCKNRKDAFFTEEHVHTHVSLHHPSNYAKNEVSLSEVAKSFVQVLALPSGNHVRGSLIEEDIYMCLRCQFHVPDMDYALRHLKYEHPGLLKYACPLCRTFSNTQQDVVRTHLAQVHGEVAHSLQPAVAMDGVYLTKVTCVSTNGQYTPTPTSTPTSPLKSAHASVGTGDNRLVSAKSANVALVPVSAQGQLLELPPGSSSSSTSSSSSSSKRHRAKGLPQQPQHHQSVGSLRAILPMPSPSETQRRPDSTPQFSRTGVPVKDMLRASDAAGVDMASLAALSLASTSSAAPAPSESPKGVPPRPSSSFSVPSSRHVLRVPSVPGVSLSSSSLSSGCSVLDLTSHTRCASVDTGTSVNTLGVNPSPSSLHKHSSSSPAVSLPFSVAALTAPVASQSVPPSPREREDPEAFKIFNLKPRTPLPQSPRPTTNSPLVSPVSTATTTITTPTNPAPAPALLPLTSPAPNMGTVTVASSALFPQQFRLQTFPSMTPASITTLPLAQGGLPLAHNFATLPLGAPLPLGAQGLPLGPGIPLTTQGMPQGLPFSQGLPLSLPQGLTTIPINVSQAQLLMAPNTFPPVFVPAPQNLLGLRGPLPHLPIITSNSSNTTTTNNNNNPLSSTPTPLPLNPAPPPAHQSQSSVDMQTAPVNLSVNLSQSADQPVAMTMIARPVLPKTSPSSSSVSFQPRSASAGRKGRGRPKLKPTSEFHRIQARIPGGGSGGSMTPRPSLPTPLLAPGSSLELSRPASMPPVAALAAAPAAAVCAAANAVASAAASTRPPESPTGPAPSLSPNKGTARQGGGASSHHHQCQCPYCPDKVILKPWEVAQHIKVLHPGKEVKYNRL